MCIPYWSSPIGYSIWVISLLLVVDHQRLIAHSTENPLPILLVAAMMCFWNLGKAILVKLAKHCGIRLSNEADFFEVLFDMVQCDHMEACGCPRK